MSIVTRIASLPGLVRGLAEKDLDPDPVRQFARWMAVARRTRCFWPTSMCLSTVSREGRPAARMMLLKGADDRGFVFYTHTVGRKADELAANPHAALTFHWNELIRQVRVEGVVRRVDPAEAAAYFATRARSSRIGAWASRQSEPLADRAAFMDRVREIEAGFRGADVPLPPHWGGYRLEPDAIEFWQGRPFRLHDRFRYIRGADGAWNRARLYP